MEEISILLTEPEPRGTLPPLRKCNVERKEPSGGGYSVPPRKCRVSLVVTSASFLGTVVSMRLVAMARTSSPVAWPSFLTDLAKIYVAFFAIIEAINMLLEWCDEKFRPRWIFCDRFSLAWGQTNDKLNFQALFSMTWFSKPHPPEHGPERAHFTKFLSNLLESLDSKLTQIFKNNLSSNELDVYIAAVRLWSISPPSDRDGEIRSKWVNFLNEMATFVEERNKESEVPKK
ncbi:uncharacterized protein LOC118433204 [Folsomia candida]|uniref:Uncharacterized protein n=1 Tax=Folsomia candida TaxID=158441 RepID=A0A226D2U2_FOLCA|nr:uncharacterized protein LOC118433204 [Folsomia candida]OXA38586.1 hypothetical protein Fcan01_26633 [Folsomia candida]